VTVDSEVLGNETTWGRIKRLVPFKLTFMIGADHQGSFIHNIISVSDENGKLGVIYERDLNHKSMTDSQFMDYISQHLVHPFFDRRRKYKKYKDGKH
jgi:hypothetical protein